MSKMRYLTEYAQLHLMSLRQDAQYDKSDYLVGQIDAISHILGVAYDIDKNVLDLTTDTDFDTLGKTIEGKEMEHEHFWDLPAVAGSTTLVDFDNNEYAVSAECACGEQLIEGLPITN